MRDLSLAQKLETTDPKRIHNSLIATVPRLIKLMFLADTNHQESEKNLPFHDQIFGKWLMKFCHG